MAGSDGKLNENVFAQAEAKARAERALIYKIVHDLNNDIAVVSGCIELIRMTSQKREDLSLGSDLDRALSALDDMKGILADLVDVVRFEEGSRKIARHPVLVSEVARAAVAEALKLADAEGKIISFDHSAAKDGANADKELLRRVIARLLAGALRNTPSGGTVLVTIRSDAPAVSVGIEDGGAAVTGEWTKRIFDRAYLLESKEIRWSRGIDLVFSRLVVESHGGRIWMETTAGGRNRTAFSIPLAGAASVS